MDHLTQNMDASQAPPGPLHRSKGLMVTLTLAAWAVGLLFIISGLTKIAAPASFALAVKHFKILPLWAVHLPAVLLPWWEVTAGCALFTLKWRRAGAAILTVMLLTFIVAIVSALVRDLDVTCGCFGEASGKAGGGLLALDLVLLSVTALLTQQKNVAPSQESR